MDKEELQHQRELLAIHRKNLHLLKVRAAQYALDVPLNVIHQIENEEREISQIENIIQNLEQSLDFPIEFRVEMPRDGQIVRDEDCPLSASGIYSSEKSFHAWVILDDKYGNFYLQNPPIRFLPKNRWEATNICPGPEIEHIHFIYVNEQGNSQFSDMVRHGHYGAFYELPPNSKILHTISIRRVTN